MRRFPGGIRIRTSAAAVVIVGVVLVLASIAMVAFVGRSVRAQVSDEAELRATQIAEAPGAAGPVVPVGDLTEEFVQVLNGGQVVAWSENVAGLEPFATPPPGALTDLPSVPFDPGPWAVFAVRAADRRTVVVGRNIDDVGDMRRTVTRALVIGIPAILAVVAFVTWWIVGRALQPVEDIRAEVEQISEQDLHRRVPGSPGGDEIARLAATMNAMLERLARGQERQRRFVSDASHELRSPVASIRQHAEVAAAHPADTEVEDLAKVMLEEDARLERLVADLLLLARLDEGARGAAAEVDLDDVVLAAAERLRTTTALSVDTHAVSAGRVLGNASQLERLIENLATNAAHHARSSVVLGLVEADGTVVLTVEDDGPGIPDADRDTVFERFVRLDGARGRDLGGTGLGLSIVREVAAAHGGSASIDEGSLGGARICVRIPRAG